MAEQKTGGQGMSQQDTDRVVNRIQDDIRNLDKESLQKVGRVIYEEGKNKGLKPTDFGWQ